MLGLPDRFNQNATQMRLERIKNFVTPQECAALNEWVYKGVEQGWLANGINGVGGPRGNTKRLTTRFSGGRFKTPKLVKDVSERVRSAMGVSAFPLIHDHGQDGFVVSYMIDGGDCHEHLDPPAPTSYNLCLRCNIMTQGAESGGKLFVNSQEIDVEAGELHCYLASEYKHRVSTVVGPTPRILWMFGAYVPDGFWE